MLVVDLATTEADDNRGEQRSPAQPTPYLGGEKVGGHEESMWIRMNSLQVMVFLRSGLGGCHGV